jgi:DHA3 family macrolide efflux protein-like MFS transporter
MLLFGPIADVVRIEWLLVGSGGVIALLGLFLMGNKVLASHGLPVDPIGQEPSGQV